VTTFMTMAYIIFVNPGIVQETGMPFQAVVIATAVSAAFATILMAFLANYPFALAPGMGLNAYFTFTVVLGRGIPWETALGAVFISGVVFAILTWSRIREAIVDAVPDTLKLAVSRRHRRGRSGHAGGLGRHHGARTASGAGGHADYRRAAGPAGAGRDFVGHSRHDGAGHDVPPGASADVHRAGAALQRLGAG